MSKSQLLELMGITPFHIGILCLVIVIFFITLEYNRFVKLRNKIRQSKSGIEVYLNLRFDLIPNLVECVKGYAKHESSTLAKIAELRNEYNSQEEKDLKKGAQINNEFNNIMGVIENNPNLQADEQFLNLQRNLEKIESLLQAARRVYNGDVTLYNTTISTFPNNIFAKIFNFKEESLFEIDEYKKQNINIDM